MSGENRRAAQSRVQGSRQHLNSCPLGTIAYQPRLISSGTASGSYNPRRPALSPAATTMCRRLYGLGSRPLRARRPAGGRRVFANISVYSAPAADNAFVRPRRCGWLDVVALRYTSRLSGTDEIAVMLLDVLSGLDELKICSAYEVDGKKRASRDVAAEWLSSHGL